MTRTDNEILLAHCNKDSIHPQIILSYHGGFVVSAWHELDGIEDELAKFGHSPAYINIIKLAIRNNAHFIQFDCDGDGYDWLPVYSWGKDDH